MDLHDHPGYLGWTSQGVIAIHADWPTYAIEHGCAYALECLGQFPHGTSFFGISDSDQCVLFRVGPANPNKDDFDESHFHVAVWHADLLELFANGWIAGVGGITPREWAVRRCEELTRVVLMLADGRPVPLPDPDDVDNTQATVALVSSDGMRLTDSGASELQRMLAARRSTVAPALSDRVEPLIAIQKYDAAVREACVFLEAYLRAVLNSESHGFALVEQYIGRLRRERRIISAQVKWLRTELRTCFRFVRNDFMHNLKDLTEGQCLAIVSRIAAVYANVLEAERP